VNHPISWVKLEKWVEMSGDTADSVMARRKAGKWLDGRQCKIVDGRVWINLAEAEKWVEQWGPNHQALAASNCAKA
jgi:hypothetical protein